MSCMLSGTCTGVPTRPRRAASPSTTRSYLYTLCRPTRLHSRTPRASTSSSSQRMWSRLAWCRGMHLLEIPQNVRARCAFFVFLIEARWDSVEGLVLETTMFPFRCLVDQYFWNPKRPVPITQTQVGRGGRGSPGAAKCACWRYPKMCVRDVPSKCSLSRPDRMFSEDFL